MQISSPRYGVGAAEAGGFERAAGNERRGRQTPGYPRRGAGALRAISRRLPSRDRRGARLSRSLRGGADASRLDGGADSRGLRRRGAWAHRGLRHHGGDQPLRRQRGRLPRPDVQYEHAGPAWLRGAVPQISARDRSRRMAAAIHGRDRADGGNGHDCDQDPGRQARRPLCRQRPESLDQPGAAFRPDDSAGAHHAAGAREQEIRGPVDLSRRHQTGACERHDCPADRQHGQPRDQRGVPGNVESRRKT